MTEPIGPPIDNYLGLIAAFRARMVELGITYSTLDEITGWTDSYASKVLGEEPIRHMGVMAFDTILATLGLKLIAVPDPEKTEKIKNHRHFVPRKHRMRATGSQNYVVLRITRAKLQEIAPLGGRARDAKLTEKQRKRLGKKLARLRWRKPRLVEITDKVKPSGDRA